jgi:hypothetical protein
MVYVPELDRQGFADRQSKNRRPRPSINYTRRDDVRDLMKSPAGKNYGNMMDLQNQAIRQGGFDKGDPKVAELKKARRQYNREDKYKIGNLMGYDPLEVQDMYRTNSEVLREHARPTYKKMYPVTDIAREVSGSGGITGMLLNKAFGKSKKAGKNFFDDLRGMGADIFGSIGIGGAVPRDEATEEILTNYATETFGPHLEDIEELDFTDEYEGPWPHDERSLMSDEQAAWLKEMNQNIYAQNLLDPNVVLPFEKERRGHPHLETYTPDKGPRLGKESPHDPSEGIRVAPWLTDPSLPMPEELIEGEKYLPGNYYDELIEDPPSIPFDDSFREEGIAGLNLAGRRPYEDEYRSFVESSGPVMVTYEDFIETYLPRIQESRGVFRAGLNSQGRR